MKKGIILYCHGAPGCLSAASAPAANVSSGTVGKRLIEKRPTQEGLGEIKERGS